MKAQTRPTERIWNVWPISMPIDDLSWEFRSVCCFHCKCYNLITTKYNIQKWTIAVIYTMELNGDFVHRHLQTIENDDAFARLRALSSWVSHNIINFISINFIEYRFCVMRTLLSFTIYWLYLDRVRIVYANKH